MDVGVQVTEAERSALLSWATDHTETTPGWVRDLVVRLLATPIGRPGPMFGRNSSPGSRSGAKSASYSASGLRLLALEWAASAAQADFIWTDLETAGVGGRCPWKRLGELAAMGWLREALTAGGERRTRKGAHRAAVQVYEITPAGIAELHRVAGNGRLPGQRADRKANV
jgi:hypothetical protein